MKKKSIRFIVNRSIIWAVVVCLFFIECSCKYKKYNYNNYQELKNSNNIIRLQSTVVNVPLGDG